MKKNLLINFFLQQFENIVSEISNSAISDYNTLQGVLGSLNDVLDAASSFTIGASAQVYFKSTHILWRSPFPHTMKSWFSSWNLEKFRAVLTVHTLSFTVRLKLMIGRLPWFEVCWPSARELPTLMGTFDPLYYRGLVVQWW